MNTITTQREAAPVGNLHQARGSENGGSPLSPTETFALLFRKYHPPIVPAEPHRRIIRVQWQEPSCVEQNG